MASSPLSETTKGNASEGEQREESTDKGAGEVSRANRPSSAPPRQVLGNPGKLWPACPPGDGRMDGQLDEWMDGRYMDDGWMGEWMDRGMDEWMDGWTDGRVNG